MWAKRQMLRTVPEPIWTVSGMLDAGFIQAYWETLLKTFKADCQGNDFTVFTTQALLKRYLRVRSGSILRYKTVASTESYLTRMSFIMQFRQCTTQFGENMQTRIFEVVRTWLNNMYYIFEIKQWRDTAVRLELHSLTTVLKLSTIKI